MDRFERGLVNMRWLNHITYHSGDSAHLVLSSLQILLRWVLLLGGWGLVNHFDSRFIL